MYVHQRFSHAKPASPLLLSLPAEIRNEIYGYAVNWPNFAELFAHIHAYQDSILDQDISKWELLGQKVHSHTTTMDTPSILTLNHQISAEALDILYRKPLILDSPPPYVPQLTEPMEITHFISEVTLRNVRFVILRMDLSYTRNLMIGAAWLKTVEVLLKVWSERNSLEWVEVQAKYTPPSKSLGWSFGEAAHHRNVTAMLSMLKDFGDHCPISWISEARAGNMIRRSPDRRDNSNAGLASCESNWI